MIEEKIEINPEIMLGKPIIRGTRIPVYVVLNLLGEGMTFEQIISDYPNITKEDILAALRFAAKFTEFEEVGVPVK
ncbi:MAG: antitoxin [Elusimicrobia bacterium CG_4_10_14_0_8_um_filter_37_32]|nr:MAG: antitoxin [Elusimicrobia bacterium CG_4_10_14_0_8_um_filter_37_32]